MVLDLTKLSPLAWNVPIVYPQNGHPTPYLQQTLVQLLVEKKANDTATDDAATAAAAAQTTADGAQTSADAAQATADAAVPQTRTVTAGTGLTGGGALTANITINASASAILDLIGSTRGSILYRGASGWAILAPGAAGTKLTSNGAGTDPTWV